MENDAARLQERISFLQELALEALQNGILPDKKVVLRVHRIPLLVRGYFILNGCYKAWRIEPNHYTETPKIAALQTLAIMKFQPFRPIHPQNVTTVAEARCNEIFAINCAAAVLGVPVEPDVSIKRDFWLRLLDVLATTDCHTLEPYVIDTNQQIQRPDADYIGAIHNDDKQVINNLICLFELLCGSYMRPRPISNALLWLSRLFAR